MSTEEQDFKSLVGIVNGICTEYEAELRNDEIDELTEEGIDGFHSEFKIQKKKKLGQKSYIPEDGELVSHDQGGNLFGADEWAFDYHGSNVLTLGFRKESEIIGLDLTGKIADNLVRFSKVMVWGSMKNSPGRAVNSPSTLVNQLSATWTFIAYLQQNNYLLNIDSVAPKPLSLLTTKELKNLIEKRMEKKYPSVYVSGFFRVVTRWLYLADRAEFPREYAPGFTIQEWVGNGKFMRKVFRYEAERISPWSDIPHDELMILLGESQAYVNDFSDDILYMQDLSRKLEQAVGPANKGKNRNFLKKDHYITGPLFDEVVAKSWAIDKRTQQPWYKVEYSSQKGPKRNGKKGLKQYHATPIILHRSFNYKLSALVDCCNFQLELWTAARVSELSQIKVEGLFIDGKRCNPDEVNAVLAFKQALGPDGKRMHKFELEFRVFKTSKDKGGRLVKIPINDDPARAFCVLVEAFRKKREKLKSPFLIPKRGLQFDAISDKDTQKSILNSYFRHSLARLCQRLGLRRHHPHSCRKTLATLLIKRSPDSFDLIQRLLNHHTPTMTLRYLMEIPGISTTVKQHILEVNRKRIVNVLVATGIRRIGGRAGENMVGGIDPKYLEATAIEETIREYVEVLLQDNNFIINEVPAAWCMRFFTHNPETLPCLPNPDLVDVPLNMFAPDATKCRPWECGHAVHTGKHLRRVQRNARESRRMSNSWWN